MDNFLDIVAVGLLSIVAIGFAYLYIKNAWNVVLQIRSNKQNPTQLVTVHFVLRVAGLFLSPLGAVMGLIPINKSEVEHGTT